MSNKLSIYDLTRDWWNFAFENPEKIKPIHTAVFMFAIEHCNRLAWKQKFGLPTTMAMEAIGVKSYKTYIGALNDLIEWGFIEMVQKSKNQHSSNVVALVKNTKAHAKALDKAMQKHGTKQSQSTDQSTVSIDIPNTYLPITSIQEAAKPEEREQVSDKKAVRKKFTPPKVAEVAEYCKQRRNGIDPEAFVAHYKSKGWKVGNQAMKDWRAAVITWEKRRKSEQQQHPKDNYHIFDGGTF